MGRWSTEMMSVLEMAWMRVWIQTLTLKETWLFLTKQQFFQKLILPSVATVQGHVGRPRSKHHRGTAMMKTSWRPNLLYTVRLRYHSPGLKSIALVSLSDCRETKRMKKEKKKKRMGWQMCPFHVDSGLVVPCITYELHKRLLSAAERHGLSLERRLEMTGVCASQMALTLLGGPNRSVITFDYVWNFLIKSM